MTDTGTPSIDEQKHKAVTAIIGATRMADTINLNRFNANLQLFRELVTEIAVNTNELILIASTITNDKEINHGIY
ncbi:MAG: hypothetical protein IJ165_00950 [Proteobacteria bacterium]|nr:hypothetical protein [Pseudomonadota bacterium]